MNTTEKPFKCNYVITDEDMELSNVAFANGTRPALITFGCAEYTYCCGMTCCPSFSDTQLLIFIVLLVAGIIFVLICTEKANERRGQGSPVIFY